MATKKEHLELAEEMQTLLLEDFRNMLRDGTASATDRATIARLLVANGWSLDPVLMGQGVTSKITKHVDPTQFDAEDDDDLRIAGSIG